MMQNVSLIPYSIASAVDSGGVGDETTVSTSDAFTGSSSFGEPCTHSLRKEYSGPWPRKSIKSTFKEYEG